MGAPHGEMQIRFVSQMQNRFVLSANWICLSKLQYSGHILSLHFIAITEKFSAMGCIARMMAMQGGERQTGGKQLLFLCCPKSLFLCSQKPGVRNSNFGQNGNEATKEIMTSESANTCCGARLTSYPK